MMPAWDFISRKPAVNDAMAPTAKVIGSAHWRKRASMAAVASIVVYLAQCLGIGAEAEPSTPVDFERDVWPVVAVHCSACHGEHEPKGGLDLRTVNSMLRGGESGPALVKSDAEASLLLKRVVDGEMPPAGERKLSANAIEVVRAWIRAGAPAKNPSAVSPIRNEDRQFWSFRQPARPELPRVAGADRARTPIDCFLLARLEALDLTYSPDADGATLVRRAYLDLLGMPPAPEAVDAYLAGDPAMAFERLVDELLASPHFGERWGRHWLDLAGYVDTVGFDTDATNIILSEGKWRYRDYVIRAWNEDKPYNRFVIEQLAGDELYDWRAAEHFSPEMLEALTATGYLRTARDLTHEDVGVIRQNFFGIMHDTLEIVGTGLLGLTVNCARCHSHKFDPIPQEDYYRMMALLTPAYNPQAWRPVIPFAAKIEDRALPDVAPTERAAMERHNAEIDARQKELQQKLAELRSPHEKRLFDAKLAMVPEPIRADTKTALDTAAEKRTEIQKYLAGKLSASLAVKPEEVNAARSAAEKVAVAEAEAAITTAERSRKKWGKIQALYDVGPPVPTHLLVRGSEESPGAEVPPGFLRVLTCSEDDACAAIAPRSDKTSGRRMALARWITDSHSPAGALLARVMVNRIWQHLFGRGIVPTPDNFGAQGQQPTHPELLEWLSSQFVANGSRVKPLIRLIMLSTAYRQASHRDVMMSERPAAESGRADPQRVDPGNELLWHMRLRRLESEVVRDAILAVSGKMNPATGGPPILINARPDGMVVVATDRLAGQAEQWRRSIYFVTRRAYNLSLLTIFDQPLVATNCLQRDASAVPLQSLVMLNDAFLSEQSGFLASRVERVSNGSVKSRIETAFRLALGRWPNGDEAAICSELHDQQSQISLAAGATADTAAHQALVQLCLALFNTSEFLYVE